MMQPALFIKYLFQKKTLKFCCIGQQNCWKLSTPKDEVHRPNEAYENETAEKIQEKKYFNSAKIAKCIYHARHKKCKNK